MVLEEPIEEPIEDPIQIVNINTENVQFIITKYVGVSVPKIIFVIPYRDRLAEKEMFINHMNTILTSEQKQTSKIFIIEQFDTRTFNRGAMKNIGFLCIKKLYPNDYKNITIVFNDIDTMPKRSGLIDYDTVLGNIKHFYGFTFALGGIVSIKGHDFEKLNGFPNYWAWGFEDNLLNKRAKKVGINIDRRQFYPINSPEIIQLKGPVLKNVNRGEFDRYIQQNTEGIQSIKNLEYVQQSGELINNFLVKNFSTEYNEDIKKQTMYDLRNGPSPFKVGFSGQRRARMGMIM